MIKKILKIVAILLVVSFIVIQFFRPDRTNQPEVLADTLEASTDVPPDVDAILSRSCVDCHSNRTVYPWYSNVAPVSWLVANDIRDGRGQVNFSVWNTYDTSKKVRKLDAMCEQVEKGDMPLPSYLWIHRNSVLRPGDSETICNWTEAENNRLEPPTQ